MHISAKERFWQKVHQTPACWEWTGAKELDGYGIFQLSGRARRAHRLSYEWAIGPIGPGLLVCHSCDNPACVRPSHLFLGAAKDNAQDMISKRRHNFDFAINGGLSRPGGANTQAKLSPDAVAEIRRLYQSGSHYQYELAALFGVGQSQVGRIVRQESWVAP